MAHIVIIGNGISGITAARHIRKKSNHEITVISSETPYFFSRTALMYVYMGHLTFNHTKPYEDWFWKKNRISLLQDHVQKVDVQKKTLHLAKSQPLHFNKLIIASGSKPSFYNWPGQNLKGVQGLYSKQDLDLLETNAPNNNTCKRAVIVGGGLIGVELAEMLHSREIPVTFLVREPHFWSGVLPQKNAQLLDQHILSHGIDLQLNTSLKEIIGDKNGKTKGVVTTAGQTIACNLVGITTGVTPNISFLEGSGIHTDKGVLVNKHLQTNIPHIYAIGDCAQQITPVKNRRPIEAVWYTGRIMGETLAQTICGHPTPYQPSHWFNSAKFFDIEYQTYGWVHPEKNKPDHEIHFHWQHPLENIAITIAYEKQTHKLLGINSFGIRIRHQVLDQWLTQEKEIPFVLAHWADAVFDPEFTTSYHLSLIKAYNTLYHTQITAVKKSWKRIFNRLKKKV